MINSQWSYSLACAQCIHLLQLWAVWDFSPQLQGSSPLLWFSLMHPYKRTGSCDLLAETCLGHHSQVSVSGRATNTLKRLQVHFESQGCILPSTGSQEFVFHWQLVKRRCIAVSPGLPAHWPSGTQNRDAESGAPRPLLLPSETNCAPAVSWAKQWKQMIFF